LARGEKMRFRPLLIAVSVVAAMAAAVVWFLIDEHVISFQQEVLVSSGMTLTPQWLELKPKTRMKTAADWSELFIEVPGLVPLDRNGFPNKHLLLADGSRLEVEGYLTADNGDRVYLDDICVVGDERKSYLDMSNNGLQWKKRNYSFSSVTLRSNKVITTGRAVWVSHDPRTSKDGMAHPELLE
jgi:hypothetical protein